MTGLRTSSVMLLGLAILALSGCGEETKSEKITPTAPPPPAVTYHFDSGQCLQSDNGAVVDPTLCNAPGHRQENGSCLNSANQEVNGAACNMEYYKKNYGCYSSANDQPVSSSYCLLKVSCVGTHYYYSCSGDFFTWCTSGTIRCDGDNCAGMLLYGYYGDVLQEVFCQ